MRKLILLLIICVFAIADSQVVVTRRGGGGGGAPAASDTVWDLQTSSGWTQSDPEGNYTVKDTLGSSGTYNLMKAWDFDNNGTSRHYYDFGADSTLGDWDIDFAFYIDDIDNSGNEGPFACGFFITDGTSDWPDDATVWTGVDLGWWYGNTKCASYGSHGKASDFNISEDTWYWATFTRSTNTVTVTLYSDSARTSSVGSSSDTDCPKRKLDRMYIIGSYNNANTEHWRVYFKDLVIQDYGAD